MWVVFNYATNPNFLAMVQQIQPGIVFPEASISDDTITNESAGRDLNVGANFLDSDFWTALFTGRGQRKVDRIREAGSRVFPWMIPARARFGCFQ
jgi:hypothetical protein